MSWQAKLEHLLRDRRSGSLHLLGRTVHLCAEIAHAGAAPEHLVAVVERLQQAHPAMALLWNLGQRLREQAAQGATVAELVQSAQRFAEEVAESARQAVESVARELPSGASVLTHSAGTQLYELLRRLRELGKQIELFCTLSLPGGEGATLARTARRLGMQVCLVCDLQAYGVLKQVQLLLLGADALCLDGLVHKVGSAPLAYLAWMEHRPVWVLACSQKLLPQPWSEELEGEAPPCLRSTLPQRRALYDCTPWEHLTLVATEQGLLSAQLLRKQLLALTPEKPSNRGQ
jgi:translation initiation factor 2B subunit (eIF-2B alpha/beta/delta family)